MLIYCRKFKKVCAMTASGPNASGPNTATAPTSRLARLKKNLLTTVAYGAIGGVYFGIPLYLIAKNRDAIGGNIKTGVEFAKGVAKHFMFNAPLPQLAPPPAQHSNARILFNKLKTPVGASLAAAFTAVTLGTGYLADNALRTEKSPNFDRLARFGSIGLVWNAQKQASADAKAGTRGFWYSFGNRLLFKGGDVGAGTVQAADAISSTARDLSAVFAEPDEEGKLIFSADNSVKIVTVCVNRTDFSNPLKDAKGNITGWKPKTGAEAEANNKKIPAYEKRLNKMADEFKKPDSDFRKALEKSTAGLVITEPGYIKDNAPVTVKPGVGCGNVNSKEYRYTAETYFKNPGPSHTPDGPIDPKEYTPRP